MPPVSVRGFSFLQRRSPRIRSFRVQGHGQLRLRPPPLIAPYVLPLSLLTHRMRLSQLGPLPRTMGVSESCGVELGRVDSF